jgi:hypothetical protein
MVNLLSSVFKSRQVCDTRRMNIPSTNRHKNHRFPAEVMSHGVWLYFRFCLSYWDIEELLFARGVTVTYEAIRKWCRKFAQQDAIQLRRLQLDDKWHPFPAPYTVKRWGKDFTPGRASRAYPQQHKRHN